MVLGEFPDLDGDKLLDDERSWTHGSRCLGGTGVSVLFLPFSRANILAIVFAVDRLAQDSVFCLRRRPHRRAPTLV